MSAHAPPAHPRLEHTQVERIAYRQLVKGKITTAEYLDAIAPPAARKKYGKKLRRWLRAHRAGTRR